MATRWIIGLSSGTSVDGVDAALLEVDGIGLELRARPMTTLRQQFARDLRELIQRVSSGEHVDGKQVVLLHRLLGETFAAAARQVADRASMSLQMIQCLGCPGHTIWHEPDGRFPSTLALGMPAAISERTGVTTVSHFRARDLVVGGQGVPLSALPDFLMFRNMRESRTLVHLGGLARIVHIPAGARPHNMIGFEAGPCSLLLDGLIQRFTSGKELYDAGGRYGVQGCCNEALLECWLKHPYLQRRPPKSLSRHNLVEECIAGALDLIKQGKCSVHDLLCTATHFVARCIASALQRFIPRHQAPERILLSGGGVRNGLLRHLLGQYLEGVSIEKTDQHGVPADTRKAVEFGLLAALTVDGVPANVPATTGAAGARLLGSLTPGSSTNWARCVAWMAGQTAGLAAVPD